MRLVLGEMDVARMNPHRSDQGTPSAPGLVRTPTASGSHPIPGVTLGLPLTRWTTSTRPGSCRASGIGDGVWRGQNAGSVESVGYRRLAFGVRWRICRASGPSHKGDHHCRGRRARCSPHTRWLTSTRPCNEKLDKNVVKCASDN